ncbi:MAG: signal recognition particle-docking protein FtsY [Thermoplasmata archaeon]|nr:signal recognition particle-docking protein FtsY [Thermoplasmata archaeon]NIS12925.1 signal recognition particle-docking protein FtsY [Thermoplasmata archaeon]NIS20833.1 signal recognition particle-docking protein FtsY [Thermoplasmata archaeon]NIT78247.1 signal recognition particle-docking protein FtsY [Thermoplasmata archaeon]NIU49892.1 signal recognition particle-docking protein FtsY [Thermoplasmata archaeon]
MFKNLKDRLGGFKGKLSKKLEEELEAVPEEELRREERAAASPPPTTTKAPEPAIETPERPAPPPAPVDRKAQRADRRAKRKGRKEKPPRPKKEKVKATAPTGDAAFTDSIMGKMLKEKKLDDLLDDLEVLLLESDVALPVAEEIKEVLKEELVGRRLKRDVDVDEFIEAALRDSIRKVLSVDPVDLDVYVREHEKPVVLMFVGVNGTGKTTAIARIAHRYKKQGYSVVLAAGDTFRAGAIEQLTIHSERLGVKIIKHKAGSDPAAVAYDAVEHAKARYKDIVLIDTAGRMQTNVNLMDEMKKIQRIAKPDQVVFVGDSLAGNDAVEQARKFEEAVGIDFAILTKIDADAKGGAALSIAHAVGKPIAFVGTGQEYDDLEVFDPDWMVDRLFA